MTRLQRSALFSAMILAAVPLVALSEIAPDVLEHNRERLDSLRRDANDFARFRKAAEVFVSLPKERRQEIIELQRRLEEQPPTTQTRLLNALERYAGWLTNLEPDVREMIEQEPDTGKRLRLIRKLREQEWLERQPEAVRGEIAGLQGEARKERIQQVRAAERQRRHDWQFAVRFWDELSKKQMLPSQLSDFPFDVQNYVSEFLLPKLTEAEKVQLRAAEGQWPRYPKTLVALADRHPIAFPGPNGPRTFNELPREVQKRLKLRVGAPLPRALQAAEGQWPEFAQAISLYAYNAYKRENLTPLPHGMWPAGYRALTVEVQEFVDKLSPLLSRKEHQRLLAASGKWPDYPQTLERLAHKHGMHVPWPNLPGPVARWERYR